ncbi:MAG: folate-binding protein, partial [Corynebacterium matruchotii]
PGTPIVMGPATGRQRTVGRIGTVIHDHEFGPIALALLKRAALTSQALMAGESAILVDPDFIPAEEQSQAGRVAINRLRGSETQQ